MTALPAQHATCGSPRVSGGGEAGARQTTDNQSLPTLPSMPNSDGRHHVSSVCVEHFRSFGGGGTTVAFQPGFTVVVGANGSGKSNLLDAMLFALAQEPSVLRVRSWAELQNRHRAGPCAVRLTISDGASPPALVLLAHAKQNDGTRTFRLNGGALLLAGATRGVWLCSDRLVGRDRREIGARSRSAMRDDGG